MFGISPLGITLLFVSAAVTAWGIFESADARARSIAEAIVRLVTYGITVALWVHGSFAAFFVWQIVVHIVFVMSELPQVKEQRKAHSATMLITMGVLIQVGMYGLFQLIR